jgi:hypothetical protein
MSIKLFVRYPNGWPSTTWVRAGATRCPLGGFFADSSLGLTSTGDVLRSIIAAQKLSLEPSHRCIVASPHRRIAG